MRLTIFELGWVAGQYPIPAYLVQTDDGRNVLIDSGYRPGPEDFLQVAEAGTIVPQLSRLGVRPEDVDLLVASHIDADHVGFHDAFPSAEIVVQRTALEAARASDDPRFAAYRSIWDAPGLRFREVEGDVELFPGLELIKSGGHVPGHQSVLVRLSVTGPVLLAIDAIPARYLADPEIDRIPQDLDPEGTKASVRKLNALAEREGVALTVYGHDPEAWAGLRKSPEFYE